LSSTYAGFSGNAVDWRFIMALPVLGFFVAVQRYVVAGGCAGGTKG
jgi:ABC-type glycerol-3-phosphate transport system permease component